MNINDVFRGFSKAMYSTWFLHRPYGLLFDCGEGVATQLNSQVFAINSILLSHGHLDHIMGLPGLIFARSAARGDKTKALEIVYPKGDPDIPRIREFVEKSFEGEHVPPFNIFWREVVAGQTFPCSKYSISSFETRHDPGRLTLGYVLFENRKKLRPEFKDMTWEMMQNEQLAGKELFDMVPRRILVYSGDTTPQDLEVFSDAELVIHESTFLNAEDIKYDSHSCLDAVLKVMQKRQPKELLLSHFSTRYSPAMCGSAVRKKAEELMLTFDVWVQYGEYTWRAFSPFEIEEKKHEPGNAGPSQEPGGVDDPCP